MISQITSVFDSLKNDLHLKQELWPRNIINSVDKLNSSGTEHGIPNLITPMSDQDRISPYNINTILTR